MSLHLQEETVVNLGFMRWFVLFLWCVGAFGGEVSRGDLEAVGRRVWQNECGGSREGLTSWNTGEDFASLGIGHFIWYPSGRGGPFEESFPRLLIYLEEHRVRIPEWLKKGRGCPWGSRAEFQGDSNSARMKELRELLAGTVGLQSGFLALRMREALPRMLAAAEPRNRGRVEAHFRQLAETGAGTFALIDYVNFKGEGVQASERYLGRGWGLLQVLEGMEAGGDPVAAFAGQAAKVLAQRVKNAPPERNEARWLPGWQARVLRYAR